MKELCRGVLVVILYPIIAVLGLLDVIRSLGSSSGCFLEDYWSKKFMEKILGE